MRAYRTVFALAVFTLAAFPAAAQEDRTVEVTPYVAMGSFGSSPVGGMVTFPVTSSLSVESETGYRRAEGRIPALSSSVSLMWSLPRVGQSTPYVIGGIGLTQYGAPVFSRASGPPIGTQSRIAMTMNAGGGLKTPVNKSMDLRTDARWTKMFGKQGSESFRVAQGLSFDVGKR